MERTPAAIARAVVAVIAQQVVARSVCLHSLKSASEIARKRFMLTRIVETPALREDALAAIKADEPKKSSDKEAKS